MTFEFAAMVDLLRRSENDPRVRNFFGKRCPGLSVTSTTGHWSSSRRESMLYSRRHRGYRPRKQSPIQRSCTSPPFTCTVAVMRGTPDTPANYRTALLWADPEGEVLRKMGRPLETGGGGVSKLLGGPVPHWFRYPLGDNILHVQLDAAARVELVTPLSPEVKLNPGFPDL